MTLRISRKWYWVLGFFLFIPSLILNIYLLQSLKKAEKGITVIEVLDGDTVLLEGDVRVRLRNIDAPEVRFCGGQQAKNLLTKLVKGKKVEIKEQIIDSYGRPMALVYTGNRLINMEMIGSGWVRYHSDKNSRSQKLNDAADIIRQKGIGIFSSLCRQTENPDNPACNIKGNIDKNDYTESARKYYLPGCAQYKFTIVEKDLGEDWFCTEDEAQKAGFQKAETCR